MKSKFFFTSLAVLFFTVTLIAYLALPGINWPLILVAAGFALIAWRSDLTALSILIGLTLFGEFSRFDLLGRSLILSDLLVFIFLAVFFWKNQLHFKLNKKSRTFFNLQLIFFVIAVLSLIVSLFFLSLPEILPGLLYLIRLIEYLLLFPVTVSIISQNPRPVRVRKILLRVILLTTVLLAVAGFLQLIYFPDLKEFADNFGYDPHLNRLFSTWLDPNLLGGLFAFILIFFLALRPHQKKRFGTQLLNFLALAIIAVALFLTYSRSAYLALAVGIIILGILKSPRLLIAVIILGVIGIAVSPRAQERVGEFYTTLQSTINPAASPDPTSQLRLQNWQQTLYLINQRPLLGQGYNNLSVVKLKAGFINNEDVHSASGSDSSLLTIFATTGVVGLVSFLLLLLYPLIRSWRSFKHSRKRITRTFGLAIFAATLTLLAHSVFVNSLLLPEIMTFFWISLGIYFSLS